TINAWNEWVEGSYLLPDMQHGFGYLEAVKNVIVDGKYDKY
ncbi:MAG: glycoside hydrolase family 99-like domain-containing protein, partial [Tannerellaceae bacterium]|nr:glycoside hydrolase family 99-like domain-containing protein [Tannerellaceae bacterium]